MADQLPILKLCIETQMTLPVKPVGIAVIGEDGTVIGFVELDWFDAIAEKLRELRVEHYNHMYRREH